MLTYGRHDIQHNDTQDKGLIGDTQHNTLCAIMLTVTIYVLLCRMSLC
jgi:hypothetical protein